ncbi:MAG: ABC transporter ATP-binding protein [Spongiibacter sp.]|uniref:ABC transporter ATP-binding protein n=1 Tax=Spongiibacter thalassae TaxID=2721624 RepID=A0ABX1GF65_9GAMM|nr:ABC transporter ATP-binding protein [Spongiibacter thalassae]MDX1505038.1 ABC transporter ATP-binding protein [Spongiibacter sp.]NKI17137.1 ABC transporter ATP-binding protein [Spongiibacter thalassae]
MIRVDNVSKTVRSGSEELTILKGISMEIKAGQSVAIVGASGSGKSTLLGLLAGLDSPSSGYIHLQGEDVTAMTEDERAALRARAVGFVFQSFQLLPTLTALENVMLPLELSSAKGARERALELLEQVGLSARAGHYPRQLSGGEQQRVALARAFVVEPDILFADEPTGNLDAVNGGHIEELLFAMNQQRGTTLVLVTHEPHLAELCERRFEMRDGQLAEQH